MLVVDGEFSKTRVVDSLCQRMIHPNEDLAKTVTPWVFSYLFPFPSSTVNQLVVEEGEKVRENVTKMNG